MPKNIWVNKGRNFPLGLGSPTWDYQVRKCSFCFCFCSLHLILVGLVQDVSGSRRIPRERHFFYFGVTSTDAPAQSLARRPICIRANLQTNFFFFLFNTKNNSYFSCKTNKQFDAIDSMRVYKCAFFSIAHTHTRRNIFFLFIYIIMETNTQEKWRPCEWKGKVFVVARVRAGRCARAC